MKDLFINILSFLGGLLSCKLISKINFQKNKLFSIFNSGSISQKNIQKRNKKK